MKISGKRPVMFYQEGIGNFGAWLGPRIRIFYPNGKTEWCALQSSSKAYDFCNPPCWIYNDEGNTLRPNSIAKAMRIAQAYDAAQGFPKMKFLGEL